MSKPVSLTYLCGCPRVEGRRQCERCHAAQSAARRRGEPFYLRPRVTETQYTCGHPRIPINTVSGGRAFPKGRCRYCRSGVLTFDLATLEPLPGAKVPSESPRGMRLSDATIQAVMRMLDEGRMEKPEIAVKAGVSRTTVYRIARGEVRPSGIPERPKPRFALVSVRPFAPRPQPDSGRSYLLAPDRRSA